MGIGKTIGPLLKLGAHGGFVYSLTVVGWQADDGLVLVCTDC